MVAKSVFSIKRGSWLDSLLFLFQDFQVLIRYYPHASGDLKVRYVLLPFQSYTYHTSSPTPSH